MLPAVNETPEQRFDDTKDSILRAVHDTRYAKTTPTELRHEVDFLFASLGVTGAGFQSRYDQSLSCNPTARTYEVYGYDNLTLLASEKVTPILTGPPSPEDKDSRLYELIVTSEPVPARNYEEQQVLQKLASGLNAEHAYIHLTNGRIHNGSVFHRIQCKVVLDKETIVNPTAAIDSLLRVGPAHAAYTAYQKELDKAIDNITQNLLRTIMI